MRRVIIGLIVGVFFCQLAHAKPSSIPLERDTAIRAVIGEAEKEGYRGMLLVACALYNRGTFKGVYGHTAVRWSGQGLYRYSGARKWPIEPSTWQLASKAWEEAQRGPDESLGATIWQSKADLDYAVKHETMDFDKLECTVIHKGHYFFKEIQ